MLANVKIADVSPVTSKPAPSVRPPSMRRGASATFRAKLAASDPKATAVAEDVCTPCAEFPSTERPLERLALSQAIMRSAVTRSMKEVKVRL